eukprot:5713585-Pleurochrysis_carterae.AAC.3
MLPTSSSLNDFLAPCHSEPTFFPKQSLSDESKTFRKVEKRRGIASDRTYLLKRVSNIDVVYHPRMRTGRRSQFKREGKEGSASAISGST